MAYNGPLVEIKSEYCFRENDCFNSYDEFLAKLELHSAKDLVYYWRRDSRTIEGAALKTSRPIASALRYYSVRHSCIFGGQKFEPKSKSSGTKKLRQSIRNDCSAHIALRASSCGQQLVVISVSNIHNHVISAEMSKNLAHTKKLSAGMKQEVATLLIHNVDKKLIREYVRLKDGKELTTKDLCNMIASLRRNTHSNSLVPDPSKTTELTSSLINYISHHDGTIPCHFQERETDIAAEECPDSVGTESEMIEERLMDNFEDDETENAEQELPNGNHEFLVEMLENIPCEEEGKAPPPSQVTQSRNGRPRTRWKNPSCFTCSSNNKLVLAQLQVLRAKRDKLREETALLRLRKRKLQLEIKALNKEGN